MFQGVIFVVTDCGRRRFTGVSERALVVVVNVYLVCFFFLCCTGYPIHR